VSDFLDTLAEAAKRTVESGYYQAEATKQTNKYRGYGLKENIVNCKKNPIIAEIKLSSPSRNIVRRDVDVVDIASAMKRGGAIGLSVVTEPKHFEGSLRNLKLVRENISIPILMKDFIISQLQVDAAYKIGAPAILLIQALFDRNYCDSNLDEMIEYAHSYNMEVLLEAHTEDEFERAVSSDSDLIGINNRDLKTLNVDLHITQEILKKHSHQNRIIVSESGIESASHVRFLRGAGARAFLVGTTVMSARNMEEKVKELVEA